MPLLEPQGRHRSLPIDDPQSAPTRPTDARLCAGLPDSLKTRGRTLAAAVGGALTARRRLADARP